MQYLRRVTITKISCQRAEATMVTVLHDRKAKGAQLKNLDQKESFSAETRVTRTKHEALRKRKLLPVPDVIEAHETSISWAGASG